MNVEARTMNGLPWGLLIPAFAVAMFAFFLLGLDQGQTLAMVQGDRAFDINLIHELVHDARHAAGFPCH
jgi:cobalt transporter subunit CbtB